MSSQQPKVLIVDDQRTNLMLMSGMLKEQNVYILEAMTGYVAIELMLKYEFAVVILDVNMPGMDGYETAELISSNKDIPRTPIVFVTAMDPDPEQVSRAYKAGAIDFMYRPINQDVINSKVKVFTELYIQKKQLQESNESLAYFSRMICHDARDPMRHIVCFADLLMHSYGHEFSDEARELVEQLSKSAYRAKLFYEDLQMFINVTNDYNIIIEDTNLNKLTSAVIDDLSQPIKESGAIIHLDKLESIRTGRTALSLIIQNLISNAMKYCEEGVTPEIHISGEYNISAIEEKKYRLSIKDNGIGIDSKYHKQIFEPFKRLHSNGSRYPGTGLGLSTCVKLAAYIDAEITLDSEEGKGSLFEIILPAD